MADTVRKFSALTPGKKISLIAIVAILSLCVMSCCCAGAIGALGNGSNTISSNVAQNQPQNSPSHQQPTNTPGNPPAPTAPSKPTATPQPTATPNPQDLVRQIVAGGLKSQGQDTNGLSVTWNAKTQTLTVEHDASDNFTNDLIKVGIKVDAYAVMKAVWTKWNIKPKQVIFHDNGPTTDKYGNQSKGPWGTAILYAGTASLFNWGNLDYSQAWDAYDVTYFINGL